MIAKIIPIKSVRKSSFSALIKYLTDPQDKSERVSQIKVSNCYSDDQTAATYFTIDRMKFDLYSKHLDSKLDHAKREH